VGENLRSVEIRGELFTGIPPDASSRRSLPQLIRPRVHTREFGRTMFHFFSDSTSVCIEAVDSWPKGFTDRHYCGSPDRGREDWAASAFEPESGLYFSLYCPKVPPQYAPLFTLELQLHFIMLSSRIGSDVDIKWPNDLLVQGKKVWAFSRRCRRSLIA
jgi:hypothetical protein